MRNRGIVRGRIFLGALLLFAAVIAWATAFLMSPHGSSVAAGTEHVRETVVVFLRNSAIGTLILCAVAGWLLLPLRRQPRAVRNWSIVALMAIMIASSIYQLIWVRTLAG